MAVYTAHFFNRERTIIGSVSYRNRYWVYCIESHRLLLYRGKPDIMCITADSAAVSRSHYKGDQRTFMPRHPPRVRHLIQVGLLLMVCMCHPLRISCVLQVTCLVKWYKWLGHQCKEYSYRYTYRLLCILEYSYRIVSVRVRIVRSLFFS